MNLGVAGLGSLALGAANVDAGKDATSPADYGE